MSQNEYTLSPWIIARPVYGMHTSMQAHDEQLAMKSTDMIAQVLMC